VPEATLVMAGDGPLREPAMRRAKQLGVGGAIVWPGFITEEQKRRLLGESAVFLAPSSEEGWGIAVAEALATELPVVAYRLPVLDELFTSAYMAVSPGDVDALAAAAARVLTDPALACEQGERGLAAVRRYDVAHVADLELEQILSKRG
jgi:glycosyltransferase involved in cell wall biosynthesis